MQWPNNFEESSGQGGEGRGGPKWASGDLHGVELQVSEQQHGAVPLEEGFREGRRGRAAVKAIRLDREHPILVADRRDAGERADHDQS